MISRKTVCISNRKHEKMYGVLSSPSADDSNKKFILFGQAGMINKSGTGDYFRLLADELAEAGYYVLRFDHSGTGDSEGNIISNVDMPMFVRKIESGVIVNDTVDVIKWICEQFSPDKVYLWGQCGGALTAVMTCAVIPESISGLMLIALPVIYRTMGEKQTMIGEFDSKIAVREYVRKLFNFNSYLRFIKGESDFNLMYLLIKAGVRRIVNKISLKKKYGFPDHKMFNLDFWDAFQKVMNSKKKVIFLMPELDNETPDFNREFKSKVLDLNADYRKLCIVEYLPQTDHSILFMDSRKYLKTQLLKWLDKTN